MKIKLYDFELSGNCYKVRLFISLLGLESELVSLNLMAGEHKTPEFLALNPLGQVPVLKDGGFILPDSQAILIYLARKYGNQWLPDDAESLSLIMRWLTISAGEVRQGVAAARLFYLFKMKDIKIKNATEKSIAFLIQSLMRETPKTPLNRLLTAARTTFERSHLVRIRTADNCRSSRVSLCRLST